MKVLRVVAEQKAQIEEVDRDARPLAADEVTGRTICTLISPGTELNVYRGEYHKAKMAWGSFPATPGYAAAFKVDGVGAEVTDIKPGDVCYCMGPHQTFQRKARKEVLPIPAGLAPEKAVWARIINITMTTYSTTEVRPPETVLVTGLGIVGLMAAQMFNNAGYNVVGVDTAETRRQVAQRLGIGVALPAVPAADAAYKGKVGLVVECTGHEQAVVDATWCLRSGGEIVLVGVPMSARTGVLALEAFKAIFRANARMVGGSEWRIPRFPDGSGKPSVFGNMAVALQWLARGKINVDGLATTDTPANCQKIFQDLLNMRTHAPTVLLDWSKV
jgi:threonine dehydrogenase-like Zn-dependent dehydrogenase